jgi:glycosyltransferase involved in cell wall biosynthesis
LNSLLWVDEIVVLDAFSTDKTIEICQRFNCKIIQREWEGYGKAKKFAVENARNNWILSIDADEVVSDKLRNEIKAVLDNPKFNVYKIKINSFFLDKEIKYCGWNKEYKKRLFNKEFGNFNESSVHEAVLIKGTRGIIHSSIYHYTYPSIQLQIHKMNLYSDLGAKSLTEKQKSGNVILAIVYGIFKFCKMYFFQLGFLDGYRGLILSINTAFGVYLKYIKLWSFTKS